MQNIIRSPLIPPVVCSCKFFSCSVPCAQPPSFPCHSLLLCQSLHRMLLSIPAWYIHSVASPSCPALLPWYFYSLHSLHSVVPVYPNLCRQCLETGSFFPQHFFSAHISPLFLYNFCRIIMVKECLFAPYVNLLSQTE